ncbi:hypothetical protein QT711_11700 [Sporosarcina saromensis]|uniref:Uncharacterized protein n=1 Tax=Sporosarcina saromensis TaxID=359365 RepID=A0ABU4GA72_9BACL|nr:hypothetical protein [Sporosarcina saromensis]MDW0113853.1 hypothetical protein [Sporosarcina saromensis]
MKLSTKTISWFSALSFIVGIGVYLYFPFFGYKGFEKALEGVLLLSSISLGFYGACLSVLASIFNTKIVREIMKDSNYKKEFVVISSMALLTGFITVIITIIYQVLLENGSPSYEFMNILNSIWFVSFLLFISHSILFVLISFIIFFKNTEDEDEEDTVASGAIKNENF